MKHKPNVYFHLNSDAAYIGFCTAFFRVPFVLMFFLKQHYIIALFIQYLNQLLLKAEHWGKKAFLNTICELHKIHCSCFQHIGNFLD